MWWEVIADALWDTLKLFPFLFLLYILIELMEHNTRMGKPGASLTGRWAPLAGAATGLVPMCGFSVMAAKLYEHRHLTLGTLLAVFLSTSDEAFLVLLLSELPWADKLVSLAAMCGIKLLVGAAVGYLADALTKKRRELLPLPAPEGEEEHCEHDGEEVHAHDQEHAFSACEHREGHKSTLSLYFVSPLLHALRIAAFILAFNLAFGFLFFGIGGGDADAGGERVVGFLQGAGYWYQPLVCCLVGAIPNCVASVALAEAYAVGGIAFGSCLAGLMTNAGLGLVVLLRKKTCRKGALGIFGVLLAVGIAAGYLVNAVALFVPPFS